MAMQFDLAELALKMVAPSNCLLYDDKNLPSVMVEIPKMKMSNLIPGGDDSTHPAFLVNGVELDSIFISKYQNVVNNGRAYSLPAMPPAHTVNWDNARKYCEDKGDGWHMMTAAEYSLIAMICMKNGFLPWGNNNYGKDSRESMYIGIPAGTYEADGRVRHILTGTGPLKYSHNNAIDGIFDINGNVAEWTGGKRTVKGEIQLLVNNNAADRNNPQTATATTWMAIDATTGEFITPNGTGTTTNSVKIKKNTATNKPQWDKTILEEEQSETFNCAFKDLTCTDTISDAAKKTLIAYLLLPADPSQDWEGDAVYFNNVANERVFSAGGYFGSGASGGVAYSVGGNSRTYTGVGIGFRSAYAPLKSAI